jgi:hypothetical protein
VVVVDFSILWRLFSRICVIRRNFCHSSAPFLSGVIVEENL